MAFTMKYTITPMYLTKGTKRRSGNPMGKVGFMVAHDTGNPQSTARGNVTYYENSRDLEKASAHIFVDDKEILECIPFLTAPPEKAWHVLYQKPLDNQLFGDDANDIAGGVEYCYGTNINADEAYKRYVWVLAYAFYKHNVDPTKLIGHCVLDPQRKTDPRSGLAKSGRTYEQLLKDVVAEYKECTTPPKEEEEVDKIKVDLIDSKAKKTETVEGVLINGVTYLPIRQVGDFMEVKVGYDSATHKAYITK